MPIRKPAVAGQFYPSDPKELKAAIAQHTRFTFIKVNAKGVMVPHAGYMYSGDVAGQVYSHIEIPNHLIILSPNHTGLGVPFSIMSHGAWLTPLGNAIIDEKISDNLIKAFPSLTHDTEAHRREHSLEVQLPFIQHLKGNFTFVPITLGHVSLEDCEAMGKAMARVIQKEKESILIIASSDMNHYEEHKLTLKKDQWAIDQITALDPRALYQTVHERKISMCGIIPTTVMLAACNHLGASKVSLIDHRTSGDVTGDSTAVVGYAGMIIQ